MNKKAAYHLCFFLLLMMITSCHHKENSGQQDGVFTYPDLLLQFPVLELPFKYNVDSIEKALPDSLRLDSKRTGKFIPDSLWFPEGNGHPKTILYPIGQRRYQDLRLLMVKIVSPDNKKADLLIYDKKGNLIGSKELASVSTANPGQTFSFSLDNKFLLRVHERKQLDNGFVITREQVYGINPDGSLLLIMTNTNEPANPNSFTNPIDTLPHKDHLSGDYYASKYDLVSIRDGKTKNTFRFFIHLNKSDGDCTGELDGTGRFTGKDVGEFQEQNGPCAVRFTFSSGRVNILEVGGCGAYRGINCLFDGTYLLKREKKGRRPHER
ncbi:MAG: hypothetical protein ACRDE2_01235 [Chitinophagaceae bacterium]